mgnify:CR=1 FL=1
MAQRRKRYKNGEKHASPGRPKVPEHLRVKSSRETLLLPDVGWVNLKKLAAVGNARAKRGTNKGDPSWRNMLRRFAVEDVPRILQFIEDNGIEWRGDEAIRFGVELDSAIIRAIDRRNLFKEYDQRHERDNPLDERPGTLHDLPGGADAQADRKSEKPEARLRVQGGGSVGNGHRGGSSRGRRRKVPQSVLVARRRVRQR